MRIAQQLFWSIIVVWLLYSCSDASPEMSDTVNEDYCLDDDFKKEIDFENPVIQPVTEVISLTGAVETNPDNVLHFVSLVSGIISNTYFSLGDQVSKGQVLAELKSTELSGLHAELKNIESQIKVADTKLQSVQSMFEDGISSRKDLLEAQSELDILRSEKLKITTNLDLYSGSTEKGVIQIKAPASGIVTAKSISAGSQISAEGASLFTISDLREVWVMVNVYASNLQHIQVGMDVEIKSLSYADKLFEGKIGAISQVYDNEARVLKARVVLPNKNIELKPGMLVDVMAMKQQDSEAISISTQAIVFDDNQYFVVVYKSDCELDIRKVEVLSRGNGVSYLSGGLQEDDIIVSQNQLLVYSELKNFQN